MFPMQGDLGEALFRSWSDEQKRDEIGRLVEGFRAGVPIGIVCNMAEKIAGGEQQAREYLRSFMPPEERQGAIDRESGAMQALISRYLRDAD